MRQTKTTKIGWRCIPADGMTSTSHCRFWINNLQVTLRPFQPLVAMLCVCVRLLETLTKNRFVGKQKNEKQKRVYVTDKRFDTFKNQQQIQLTEDDQQKQTFLDIVTDLFRALRQARRM
jgi:hypothetical protein